MQPNPVPPPASGRTGAFRGISLIALIALLIWGVAEGWALLRSRVADRLGRA